MCILYLSPALSNILLHLSTEVSPRAFQLNIPEVLNNSSIFGPIPSTIFKSSCFIFLPKTALAATASNAISSLLVFAADSLAKFDFRIAELALFNWLFKVLTSEINRLFFWLQASKSLL